MSLIVLIYLVPIIGTLTQMWRRAGQIWNIWNSLRAFFPEDRIYRRLKGWDARFAAWKRRHPITTYASIQHLNLLAGKIEYGIGHLRDYTIGLWMMAAFVYDLTVMVFGSPEIRAGRFQTLFYHGFFALLSLWTYRRHVTTGLQMTEFMRSNPHVHPQEFFDHYYRRLGPAAVPVPSKATRVVDPTHVSYKTGRPPKKTLWVWMHGTFDTAIFARSAYRALETLGPVYGREVFDVMASLWGSRMLQLFRAEMTVEGTENLKGLSGKIILVCNHKSYLDFVFNFFALSSTRLASGRNVRPRYLAAKDHFVDNKMIHSGLGVGKLIEAVNMVFVDRKGKGRDAVGEAARILLEKEVEVAMYPQGTRALANFGPKGERLDAGYYTTGSVRSLKSDLGHLKKGCAYLAVDTAIALSRQVPRDETALHLVFVGIDDVASIIPKGAYQVQTEGSVRFRIGEALTISPAEVQSLSKPTGETAENEAEKKYLEFVGSVQSEIDRRLVRILNLHERLSRRFIEELRKREIAPRENLLKINHELAEAARMGNRLPFMILDRIYALPFRDQPLFLEELAHKFANKEELAPLRDAVTDELFRHRGGELKKISMQEEARKVA